MRAFLRYFVVSLIPLIPLGIIANIILENPIRMSGYLAYMYLVLVLLVSPISYMLSKFSYTKKFASKVVPFRRPVGIIAGLLSLWHASMYLGKTRNFWQSYVEGEIGYFSFLWQAIRDESGSVLGMDETAFWVGLVGFVVMMALLITSNDLSQRILGMRAWKYVQRAVYPLFLLAVAHIYFVGGWKGLYLYPAVILIVIRFWSWFDKNFVYRGRVQITHSKYRRFLCRPCGYIYDEELGDPDGGLPPGTRYEEIPDDWVCPVCGAAKKDFVALDGHFNPLTGDVHKLMVHVVSKTMLTPDVVHLVVSAETDLHIEPGQYCNLVFEVDGESWARSYSIVKYTDRQIHFLIKLKPDGLGSNAVRTLGVGDRLEMLGPFGDFVLQKTSKKKIFVGTGTGLAPLYHMICSSWDSEKELHFGVRSEEDLFFIEELSTIPNLTVHTYVSQEKTKGSTHGRVSADHIEAEHDDEIYLCGNPNMIEELSKALTDMGYLNIYSEKFV